MNIFQRNLSLSVKFGFIGLGMGGCNIAAECGRIKTNITNNKNPYTSLLINTNTIDLDKIADHGNIKKIPLTGYEKGAGRNVDVGQQAFNDHADMILQVVKEYFADREFIWIVCGLGGGTGTGSIIEAIKMLHKNGFAGRFGLIITLPRDQEGGVVIENALDRLQTISKVMKGVGSIILVDNQHLYSGYIQNNPGASINEYLDYSNKYIADTLHEWNIITASFKPYGGQHFDSSEFLKRIQTPGVLSFSKLHLKESDIDTENESSYILPLRESIRNGVLSKDYNIEKTKQAAISMITGTTTARRIFNMDTINKIESDLDSLAPQAEEKPIATYTDDKSNGVYIYSLFTGLPLPKRIGELVEASERMKAERRTTEEDEVLKALHSFSRSEEDDDAFDIDSALSDESDEKESQNKKQNPIDEILFD